MRRFLIILGLFPTIIAAQFDISAGMGIDLISQSSLKDYVNINFSSPKNEISTFETSADFFTEIDYNLKPNFDIGVEYSLLIYSYTNFVFLSSYDISYVSHKPSVLAYYVISGEGYKLKFGGGLGLRYVSLTEQLPTSTQKKNYSANGFGAVLKVMGITTLGKNLFAYMGVDARTDFPGEPESNGQKIFNGALNEQLNLNSISI